MSEQRRQLPWWAVAWVVAAWAAAIGYVIFGHDPSLMGRIYLSIIGLALAGMPCGIWYGSQDKFWT